MLSRTEIARQPCKPCHRARFNIPTRLCVFHVHAHGVVLLCRRLFFFLLLLFLPFTQVLGSIIARCSPTFYSQPRTPSRKWFIGDAARPLDRHPCLTATMGRSFHSLPLHRRRRQKQRTPDQNQPGVRDDSHASASCDGDAVCYCCTLLPVIPTQPGATLPVPTGWQGGKARQRGSAMTVCGV